jgi:membrane protease YdiL (CAAX protease family)
MKNSLKIILIVFLSFGIYFVLDDLYFKELRNWMNGILNQLGISHIITYLISGLPLFLGTYILFRKEPILKSLGLYGSIIKGFLFALICTLPLFIGFSFIFEINPEISVNKILIAVVSAGFFEELYFRGFLFGLLYKYTKLGFVPAVFLGALIFGLIHLYQSTNISELIGIFLITFLGGLIFAWVYAEWKFNLWTAIFLHMLINFSWELFDVSDNALGGIYGNVFRFLSIVLVFGLTILYKKRKKLQLEVNKRTLWIKKHP